MKARRWWYPVTILALMVIASIVAGQHMPPRVVTHYDYAGRPNGHGSKYTLLLLGPMLAVFIGGPLLGVRVLVAAQTGSRHVALLFDSIVNVMLTILLAVHVSILARTLGYPVAIERFVPAMIGFIFIAVGRVLPGIPPNPLVGVRTPWTFRSDRVWDRSQIVGARVMMIAGVISLAASALPIVPGIIVAIALAIGAAIGVTVYSYVAWKQETESSR